MKPLQIAFVSITASLLAATIAGAQNAEDAFGVWRNPENGSQVEMYKCGADLCAKIVASGDGQKTDDKNPDASKRNVPIVGLVIMSNAKKTGPNEWKGNLYNRADGGTYSGTLTVKNKNSLDLSGCKAIVFCKTLTWTRIK